MLPINPSKHIASVGAFQDPFGIGDGLNGSKTQRMISSRQPNTFDRLSKGAWKRRLVYMESHVAIQTASYALLKGAREYDTRTREE
jgi:hypothetical protein